MNFNKLIRQPFLLWGFLLLSVVALLVTGCYRFTGISVDYTTTKTYYVPPFKNNADDAPAGLANDMTFALTEKVRQESRLVYNDQNPDIEFVGTLVDYRITSEAPAQGERTAVNRLTIVVAVEYINNVDETKGWKSNFSFFYDWPSSESFSSVEFEATQAIIDQINEDIFNKAFTDW